MNIHRPPINPRRVVLAFCMLLLCLLVFFPTVEFKVPPASGSLCDPVDKLCAAAVTYYAEERIKNIELLQCRPWHGKVRCFDLYSPAHHRTAFVISVNRGCTGRDCIRAIRPTAYNGR